MQKKTEHQYLRVKNQSDDTNDLIARLLFQLVGLQNSGNSGIEQVISDGRKRYEHLNATQAQFVEKIIESIREIVDEKEIDLSEVTDGIRQIVEGIASSNSGLGEALNEIVVSHHQTIPQLARIADLVAKTAPQEGKIVASQEKTAEKIGKLLIDLTREVKNKEFPKSIRVSDPIEIIKPSWWKAFEFSWEPLEKLFEKLKEHTFSVKVENQQEKEKLVDEDKLAKKIGKELEKVVPKFGGRGIGVDTGPLAKEETLQAIKDPLIGYKPAGMDTAANPYYFGYLDIDGKWFIKKLDTTSGTTYVKGNSDYATNWTNRASLEYQLFNIIF